MEVLAGMDFFTVDVLTWSGLATYYVLFLIHLESRRITIAGTTRHPTEAWMEPMARTVVNNVQVLTAGTRYDQVEAKDGKPQRSTVVTLAVLPADGERIALASAEGKLSLVLRNPLDVDPADTTGIKLAALMKGTGPEPVLDAPKRKMVPAKKIAAAPAPPAPQVYKVEAIRAAKRTEEAVN